MFLSRGDRDLGVAFQTHPGQISFEGTRKNTKNKVLFDELPDVFTRDMVKERKEGFSADAVKKFMRNLRKAGLIEEISKNTYRKLTNKEREEK